MRFRPLPIALLLVALVCTPFAFSQHKLHAPSIPAASVELEHAAAGIKALQAWYQPATGLYNTAGWWNSANDLTALANYSRVAHTSAYYPIFANTLTTAPNKWPNFLNQYYDDEGWWALAWIDVYDLTSEPRYLNAAEGIFTDMSHGWDATCGGGIWWSKERHYKNAIANELFLSVAAELAARSAGADRSAYLDWASREWAWFRSSGMINADHLVNDGLTFGTCANNNGITWSYNQGVVLGGLASLFKLTGDSSLLVQANTIATATIAHLSDTHGVLHDVCEPHCDDDSAQFKGIFLRNLATLNEVSPHLLYVNSAHSDAASIWTTSKAPQDAQFGQVWSGPYNAANAVQQGSALDALIAAAQLSAQSPASAAGSSGTAASSASAAR